MATITSTASRITIDGTYKAFTSTTGSTNTVIQYGTGDAPAAGDAGRFLMWKNDLADSGTWEIRYIESATATTVTIGDGGFSSAPGTGESFVISTNLADIETAVPTACTSSGSSYSFNGRDFELASSAFLGDVNKSLVTESTQTGGGFIGTYPVADGCALQFGRLIGGEANDSVETIGGCNIIFEVANNTLIFTTQGSVNLVGPVLNFYGCMIESFDNGFSPFVRSPGPMRLIGCVVDGPMGGRLYSTYSELVDTRFSGNANGGIAWSLGGVFTRPINNAFFFQNDTAIKAFQAFTGVFRNTTFADSNTNIIDSSGAQAGLLFTFIDCTTFLDAKITNTNGQYKQGKSINYFISDSTGTGLTGAKVAVYDNSNAIQTGIETSALGVVSQIEAIFFDRPHGSTSVDKSPFDIRIRKYGYVFQDFQSAVSEPIKQEYRLPDNNVTVLSKADAGALTGIVIDFVAKTLTLTEDHTLSEIYDYCQSELARNANMDELEFLKSTDGNVFNFNDDWDLILNSTNSITGATGKTIVFGGTGKLLLNNSSNNIDGLGISGNLCVNAAIGAMDSVAVSGTVDYATSGTYNLTGANFNEVVNTSSGAVTLSIDNATTITTNTGPNITIEALVNIVAASLLDNTRVQIYNITKGLEIDNSLVSGGSGYSVTVNLEGANVDEGDTIRLRATYINGVTAKNDIEAQGVITQSGLSFINSQEDNEPYNTWALDGSAITKFSPDYVDDEVDIVVTSNFELREMGAWWQYNLTTESGIREFFGGLVFEDEANIRIENSVVNIFMDNTTAVNVFQTDNRRLYRVDGARPVKNPTTDAGIDLEWRSPVTIGSIDNINNDLTVIKSQTSLIPSLV